MNEHHRWKIHREKVQNTNVARIERWIAWWSRQVEVQTRRVVTLLSNEFVHAANVRIVDVDEALIGQHRAWSRRWVREQILHVLPGDHACLSVDAKLSEQFFQVLLDLDNVVVHGIDADEDTQGGTRFPWFDHAENGR